MPEATVPRLRDRRLIGAPTERQRRDLK